MKTAFVCVMMVSACVAIFAEDFTTTDGKKLEGVTVTRVETDGIRVMTDSGIQKIPFSKLPVEVQKKYGFDSAKPAQPQRPSEEKVILPTVAEASKRLKEGGYDLSKPLPDVSEPGKLGGFLGMPWGTPPEIAKQVMLARKGTNFVAKESNQFGMYFTGGTFSEHEVEFIGLEFVDGGLSKATVKFANPDEVLFDNLRTGLSKKYGMADDARDFSAWRFPNQKVRREELFLSIGQGVWLTYSHIALHEKAEQQSKNRIGTKDL
ncbi:MAG: hypothetical protein NTV08_11100 [Verrucomicrobia bacterium]|nr:hypothetical protein [Verrucomicrobiota bacterium]